MTSSTYDYHQDADIMEVFFADEEATAAVHLTPDIILANQPDPVERPDDEPDPPANLVYWHRTKEAGIPGLLPVVAQDKDVPRWHA